jgi:hypothetical protein
MGCGEKGVSSCCRCLLPLDCTGRIWKPGAAEASLSISEMAEPLDGDRLWCLLGLAAAFAASVGG